MALTDVAYLEMDHLNSWLAHNQQSSTRPCSSHLSWPDGCRASADTLGLKNFSFLVQCHNVANPRQEKRIAVGKRRIVNVLRKHGVATTRMLEQKISDAGPYPQRIDPHLLTVSRAQLISEGTILTIRGPGGHQWHHLSATDLAAVQERFDKLSVLHQQTEDRSFTLRIGQTAEIAVYKAMKRTINPPSHFFGHFPDLDKHDDSRLYSKTEPPNAVSGKPSGKGVLDFLLYNPAAALMGIEVKNIREWIYPDRETMKDLLHKCSDISAVPVLIARRIHYSTFSVMNSCGVVIHQFYNQLYPFADTELAEKVRPKLALGYFDLRVGNEPDVRMLHFFAHSLPIVAEESRRKFAQHEDTIAAFVGDRMSYAEFLTRIKGREWIHENDESEPGAL
jgi:hypothetical protein